MVFLNGSAHHDSVCGTCDDVAKGGLYIVQLIITGPHLSGSLKQCLIDFELASSGEAYRTFLAEFFSMHRMRVGKMKKFVAR